MSGSPPNYQFNVPVSRFYVDEGISLEDFIKAGNRFRRAFRKGKFRGDDRYISVSFLDWGRFAKVVQVNEMGITVDLITYNGQIKQLTLSQKDVEGAKVSLAAKGWFERREEAPASVGPFDIPQFNEEKKYKAMGLRRIFYTGLNKVKQRKYLAEKLREANIDPFRTHVMDFVPLIEKHLAFIERGIREQGQNVSERLAILEDFRKEAEQKSEKGECSLYWWLHWNFRLVWLASLSSYEIADSLAAISSAASIEAAVKDLKKFRWLTDSSWNEYLNENMRAVRVGLGHGIIGKLLESVMRYPEQMYLPVLDNLGLITVNEAFADQDFVKQIIINKEKIIDGRGMNPIQFEDHEMGHINIFNSNQKDEKIFSQFYMEWRKIRDDFSFSPEIIEMVEFTHWYLSKETYFSGSLTDDIGIIMAFARNSDRFEEPTDLKKLLPPEIDGWTLAAYFEESAKVFSQIARAFKADKE